MKMTWTCHICHRERPDDCIDVFKKAGVLAGRFPYTENIRFCNDNRECIQQAPLKTLLPTTPSVT